MMFSSLICVVVIATFVVVDDAASTFGAPTGSDGTLDRMRRLQLRSVVRPQLQITVIENAQIFPDAFVVFDAICNLPKFVSSLTRNKTSKTKHKQLIRLTTVVF